MQEFVSKDVCEERKERFEQMFEQILANQSRIEQKVEKSINGNGKLLWNVVGVMMSFMTLTVTIVITIVKRLAP